MKQSRLILVFVFLALIGFIFDGTKSVKFVKQVLGSITQSGSKLFGSRIDPENSLIGIVNNIKKLEEENHNLKIKNIELDSQVAKLKEFEHENTLLKNELEVKNDTGDQQILASVVGRSVTGARNDLIVDKGGDDGVKEGQTVVANGFLVGKVSQVYSKSSRIATILNHNLLITVTLQDSRALGIMHGGLDGLVVEQIPVDAKIKEGENVVTTGIAGEIVKGISVGHVKQVISKKADIFQSVVINTPIQYNDLELLVIKKGE